MIPHNNNINLQFVSADPCPRLMLRVVLVDENTCLACDKFGSVFVLSSTNGQSSADRTRTVMQTVAQFTIGETITRIIPLFPKGTRSSAYLLCSLAGSLFTVFDVRSHMIPVLSRLVQRIKKSNGIVSET